MAIQKTFKLYSSFLGICICSSCMLLYPVLDDKLTLDKRDYKGKQLRMDGYYYYSVDDKLYATYFLYQNGLIIHGGGSSGVNPFESFEREFSSVKVNKYLNTKNAWGLFNIQGDSILIERWYPSSGGPSPVYLRAGRVLNDTTFVITKSVRSKNGKEEQQLNEVYRFREFSPKPDSTNTFIK